MRYSRLNTYLDSPDLWGRIEVAAARAGVTLSEHRGEAIRWRLAEERFLPPTPAQPQGPARSTDRLRRRIGPVGVAVRELIAKGRRR